MKFDQFLVSREQLQFITKDIQNDILGVSFTDAFIYFTPKASIFPFAINKDNEVIELEESFVIPNASYANLSTEERIRYLQWLSLKFKYTEDDIIKEPLFVDFMTIYFQGLEYRSIVEQKNCIEILDEITMLLDRYSLFMPKVLRNDMVNLILYTIFNSKKLDQSQIKNAYKELIKLKDNFVECSILKKYLSILTVYINSYNNSYDITKLESFLPMSSGMWKDEIHQQLSSYAYNLLIHEIPEGLRKENITKIYNFSDNKNLVADYPFYGNVLTNYMHSKLSNSVNALISKVKTMFLDVKMRRFDEDSIGEADEFVSVPLEIRSKVKNNPLKDFNNISNRIVKVKNLIASCGINKNFDSSDSQLSLESSKYLSACMHSVGLCIEPDPFLNLYSYNLNQSVIIYKSLEDNEKYEWAFEYYKPSPNYLYIENLILIYFRMFNDMGDTYIKHSNLVVLLNNFIDDESYGLEPREQERLRYLLEVYSVNTFTLSYEAIVQVLLQVYRDKKIVYIMHIMLLSYVLYTNSFSVMTNKYYNLLLTLMTSINADIAQEKMTSLIDNVVERFININVLPADFVILKTEDQLADVSKTPKVGEEKTKSKTPPITPSDRIELLLANINISINKQA
jgi:hypothetical protein